MKRKRVLKISLDESGDYDSLDRSCPIYALGMVLLSPEADVSQDERYFKRRLSKMEGGEYFVHTGNLVRNEEPYKGMLREDRQKLFWALAFYAFKIPASFAVIYCRKESADRLLLLSRISRRLSSWIEEHLEFLKEFDEIEVSYDYGQSEIAPMVTDVFRDFDLSIMFVKREQSESTLLQVADLLCECALLQFKFDEGNFTHSEQAFFGLRGKIKKDLLSPIKKKLL